MKIKLSKRDSKQQLDDSNMIKMISDILTTWIFQDRGVLPKSLEQFKKKQQMAELSGAEFSQALVSTTYKQSASATSCFKRYKQDILDHPRNSAAT